MAPAAGDQPVGPDRGDPGPASDIAVILVEPGITRTRIWTEGRQRGKELADRMPSDQRERYRPLLEALDRASADGAEVIVDAVQESRARRSRRWPDRAIERGMGR